MRIKRTSFIPSLLLCLTHLTYADQNTKNNPNDKESTTLEDHSDKKSEDTASAWKGSNAQLGITANTGNTKPIEGNKALNVNYAKPPWKNSHQRQLCQAPLEKHISIHHTNSKKWWEHH